MFIRYLLIGMLLALGVSGCMEQSGDVTLPQQPSLGRDFITFQPPAKSMENPDILEIPEPTGPITLRQALALALLHNPELKAFSWDIRAAEAGRLQASLRPNPSLDVAIEEVGGAGNRSGFDGAETTIAVAQPIEMGQKRAKRTTLASLERELAEWDYEAKRLDVTREVTGAFIAVLAAQEHLSLSKELVDLSEKAYSTVAERVRAGEDSPVEETKAKIALSNTRIEFERAGKELVSARHQLPPTWGSSNPAFEKVSGGFYDLSPAPSLEELAGLISQNPDMARWPAEKERRRAALDLEKARAASDIKLGGGIQYFDEGDDSAFILGLSIPMPLFDRNQGNIQEAMYMLAKTEEQRKAVETDLRAGLAEASTKLSSSFSEINILKNDVLPLAKSAFDAAGQGYREGKFEYLMVLDSQRTFFEVRARYIEALAGYHKARADVERLIGRDLDTVQNTLEAKAQENI